MSDQEQRQLAELEESLCALIPEMRRAIDQSVLLAENERVTQLWEEFLAEFVRYVRAQGNQHGKNLLNRLSMSRILSLSR